MSRPASLTRLTGTLTCLALLVGGTSVSAQQTKPADDKKTESEEAIFIPIEYRPPPWQVSVGVRLSGKAKVKFSGLGSIPLQSAIGPVDDKTTKAYREYDNGYVGLNLTVGEKENAVYGPAADNKTNTWSFTGESYQVVADANPANAGGQAVQFSSSYITSTGASNSQETDSSYSWDIEISRELGGSKRYSWGLIFGAGLSDLKAKTSATVTGELRSIVDTYSLTGSPLTATTKDGITTYAPTGGEGPIKWYQALTADGKALRVNEDGTPYMIPGIPVTYPTGLTGHTEWRDNSVRLSDLPYSREDILVSPIDVIGEWRLRGAYLTARFGPYFAVKFGEHLQLRGSAGVTFTVLGTRFTFEERAYHPVIKQWMNNSTGEIADSTVTGNIGYFVSGELDWFLTQRTGLFIGALHEDYARELRMTNLATGQIADIDVSAGTVIRTGITTRF